jgi:hypothetical protein
MRVLRIERSTPREGSKSRKSKDQDTKEDKTMQEIGDKCGRWIKR